MREKGNGEGVKDDRACAAIRPLFPFPLIFVLSILVQYFCISIEQLTTNLIDADVAEAGLAGVAP